MDLQSAVGNVAAWDPSTPFSWDVRNPCMPERFLIDDLPAAKDLYVRRLSGEFASDFEAFGSIAAGGPHDVHLTCELRHYLAIAYSNYHRAVAPFLTGRIGWQSARLIETLADAGLTGLVSYNYDINIESVLEAAGHTVRRLGVTNEPLDGIPTFKPHGSIDFAPAEHVFHVNASYPLSFVADLNDMPIRRLISEELTRPRIEADLVLPAEKSKYIQFQWVRSGWGWLQREARQAQTVVLFGLSFWPCDRYELDAIVRLTHPLAQCVVVNPWPSDHHLANLHTFYRRPLQLFRNSADLMSAM